MRKHLCWAVFLAVIGLSGCVASAEEAKPETAAVKAAAVAEEAPTGDAVLERFLEATGGKEAYAKLRTTVVKGTMEMPAQGIKATLTIFSERPDRMRTVAEFPGIGTIESGFGDGVAWELSPMTGPRIKEGEEKALLAREAQYDKYLTWRKFYKSAECTGAADVDGKPAWRVVMTPNEGKPTTLFFDRESGLLWKAEMIVPTPMGDVPASTYPSDWKAVDGVLAPHKSRTVVLQQERIMTMESIQHNVEIPAEHFVPPAEVKALLEKEERGKAETPPPAQQK